MDLFFSIDTNENGSISIYELSQYCKTNNLDLQMVEVKIVFNKNLIKFTFCYFLFY